MKLLHIDTSILGEASASRVLSSAVVERLTSLVPDAQVTYRDLAVDPIPHLSGAHLVGPDGEEEVDPVLQDERSLGARVLDEFLDADVVVIGVALYNFGISSQLKAWIDRITIAGKTFRYTEQGPEGLAGDKRLILGIARGGLYGPGSGREAFEHAETYLRALFGFLGVKNPEVIVAEGMKVSPEHRETSIANALKEIGQLQA